MLKQVIQARKEEPIFVKRKSFDLAARTVRFVQELQMMKTGRDAEQARVDWSGFYNPEFRVIGVWVKPR